MRISMTMLMMRRTAIRPNNKFDHLKSIGLELL